ncbi:MAG: methylornithine synthase PylB [Candidatus Methanomethylophilaceae archaeon]|nr:methylornithine synthase PylB [Candidatus Methanomethylophilaceae archaeon]
MITDIITRVQEDGPVDVEDVYRLMSAEDPKDLEELYAAARKVRDSRFGRKIFTYGFVYYSTYCKNNCTFCYYRNSNHGIERYRKGVEEVVQLSGSLKDAGINLADLTTGEDPKLYADDYRMLLDTIRAVRDEVGISIMSSPGALPREMFPRIREAGADWHACYQETYNRDLFSRLRLDQSFDDRRNQKVWAMEAGLLAEDGMMMGLGENVRDRAETILEMGNLGCSQIRAMTFVPQEGTPMQDHTPYDSTEELKAIAVMRILFPDRLIPCSLDVEGIAGLKTRIAAGANVITSIVPPNRNLAGVAQHELDIENGNRSVEHVFEMLEEMGYRHATNTEYTSFLDSRRTAGGA